MARAVEHCLSEFIGQVLANRAWAFAKTQSDAPIFMGLARAVERRLGELIAQIRANWAWVFCGGKPLRCVDLYMALARPSKAHGRRSNL